MTREEAIAYGNNYYIDLISACCKIDEKHKEFVKMSLKALEQEPTIKALGEELRKARKGIADEKVLIGFNMAVAICNKHLGESEVEDGNTNK